MDLFNPKFDPKLVLAEKENNEPSAAELLDEAIVGIGRMAMILDSHKEALSALAHNVLALETQIHYLLSKDPTYVAAAQKLADEASLQPAGTEVKNQAVEG